MVINWYGLSSFNISTGKFTLVTDPFSKSVGLTPVRVQTNVAVISNIEDENYNNKSSLGGPASASRSEAGEDTFVIDGPGEFDVQGLFVRGIPAFGNTKDAKNENYDPTTLYSILMEDIRLGFLGSLKQKELTDKQLEDLGNVDILFVPVGGNTVCDAEEAVNIVSQVEPSIVVPMHYHQKGLKTKLDPVDKFLKEIGSDSKPEDKLTVKKSDFSDEDVKTKIVLLDPQR